MQECYPTLVRAFYNNIKNVDEEKYLFHSSFKGVVVRVSPSLVTRSFSLKTNVFRTGPVIEPEKLPVHGSPVGPAVEPLLNR